VSDRRREGGGGRGLLRMDWLFRYSLPSTMIFFFSISFESGQLEIHQEEDSHFANEKTTLKTFERLCKD
jgi:hypothetical protein